MGRGAARGGEGSPGARPPVAGPVVPAGQAGDGGRTAFGRGVSRNREQQRDPVTLQPGFNKRGN